MILSKAQRALYESDRAAFYASLPPRKARTSPPKKVLHSVRRKKRSPEDFKRVYHSPERVRFVESLPCCHCKVEGYSVNAHVERDDAKGMGRKAGYRCIAPLCCSRIGQVGCHELYDQHKAPFDTDEARALIVAHARLTAQRWRAECARRGIE